MDTSMAAIVLAMIAAVTAILVVRILSSTPARIAATLTAVAVLFAIIPRILGQLTPPPAATTETVAPREPTAASSSSAGTGQSGTPTAEGTF